MEWRLRRPPPLGGEGNQTPAPREEEEEEDARNPAARSLRGGARPPVPLPRPFRRDPKTQRAPGRRHPPTRRRRCLTCLALRGDAQLSGGRAAVPLRPGTARWRGDARRRLRTGTRKPAPRRRFWRRQVEVAPSEQLSRGGLGRWKSPVRKLSFSGAVHLSITAPQRQGILPFSFPPSFPSFPFLFSFFLPSSPASLLFSFPLPSFSLFPFSFLSLPFLFPFSSLPPSLSLPFLFPFSLSPSLSVPFLFPLSFLPSPFSPSPPFSLFLSLPSFFPFPSLPAGRISTCQAFLFPPRQRGLIRMGLKAYIILILEAPLHEPHPLSANELP